MEFRKHLRRETTKQFTIAKRMGLKRRPNPQRLDFICLVLYQVFKLSYYAVYEYLKCLEKGKLMIGKDAPRKAIQRAATRMGLKRRLLKRGLRT